MTALYLQFIICAISIALAVFSVRKNKQTRQTLREIQESREGLDKVWEEVSEILEERQKPVQHHLVLKTPDQISEDNIRAFVREANFGRSPILRPTEMIVTPFAEDEEDPDPPPTAA